MLYIVAFFLLKDAKYICRRRRDVRVMPSADTAILLLFSGCLQENWAGILRSNHSEIEGVMDKSNSSQDAAPYKSYA